MSYRIPDWIMEVDCEIDPCWPQNTDWEAIVRSAVTALLNVSPEFDNARLGVSVLFADDAEVQALNREWRGKDKPTNVLSFPMLERADLLELAPEGPPEMLGDLALAYETCAREADEKGLRLYEHATHLIVHGLLHLAGHDHELGPAEARVMEELEIKALALLGIADPYGDH